jgi:hypothetical protein
MFKIVPKLYAKNMVLSTIQSEKNPNDKIQMSNQFLIDRIKAVQFASW